MNEILLNFRTKSSLYSLVPMFLAILLFALPLSASLKSIFLVLSLVGILWSPEYSDSLRDVLSKRWCQMSLLLFLFALVACLWSDASLHDKKFVVEKYSKLLYFPILVVGFREFNTRIWAMHAFLLAMFITCLLCMAKFFHFIEWTWGRQLYRIDAGSVFLNHIMTSYMIAFAAYIAGVLFFKTDGARRFLYVFLFVLFSYQILVINTGRTGYIMYAVLVFLLTIQYLTWRRIIIALLLMTTIFFVSYKYSYNVNLGTTTAFNDFIAYQHNQKETSIGWRMDFHKYARSLFNKSPWLGEGTAGFMTNYAKDQPLPSWGKHLLEPHSQYWLMASEFGIIGIVVLFTFFASLFVTTLTLTYFKSIAIAMLVSFCIGNISDSLLFYSGSGYFFILIMAICLGETLGPRTTP